MTTHSSSFVKYYTVKVLLWEIIQTFYYIEYYKSFSLFIKPHVSNFSAYPLLNQL